MLAVEKQLAFMCDVRIACIGDVMLDKFLYGSVERISPEAPTPVIHVHREEIMPGGAGNVVRNVAALGGSYIVVSVIGPDASGRALHRLFGGHQGSQSTLVRDKDRPTTQKTRFVSERYKSHLLRADQESIRPISDDVEKRTIQAALSAVHHADVTVVSDYRKGVVTPCLVRSVIAEGKRLAKPVIPKAKTMEFTVVRASSRRTRANFLVPWEGLY
jgi:D-beta-D-heptose 7-phosphate kinase / D-beta-D-heptose 1-phosphate adenosyltransferase